MFMSNPCQTLYSMKVASVKDCESVVDGTIKEGLSAILSRYIE